jgi:hypothetical protein
MSDELAQGGIAVAILAKNFDLPSDYAYHSQILPILASDLPIDIDEMSARFPSTTKIVLVGGEIPSTAFGIMRTILTKRKLTFVQRKNETAFHDLLTKVIPKRERVTLGEALNAQREEEAKQKSEAPVGALKNPNPERSRGAVTEFVRANADLGKGSSEEARRLLRLASAQGLQTTLGSLAQAVSTLKRKGGRTETPKSILSAQARALQVLDEAIAGLQLIRDYVEATEQKNAALEAKLARFKSVLADTDE